MVDKGYLEYLDFEPQCILEAGVGKLKLCRTKQFWSKGISCHLFEPNPEQFLEVAQAASCYPNVQVWPVALWDYMGEVTLYRYDSASWVEGVVPPREDLLQRESRSNRANTVPCCPIDFYDSGNYDLALIDVESSEWKVLQHMVSRPRLISLELRHPKKRRHIHPDIEQIRKWLKDNNYKEVGAMKADSYFIKGA